MLGDTAAANCRAEITRRQSAALQLTQVYYDVPN